MGCQYGSICGRGRIRTRSGSNKTGRRLILSDEHLAARFTTADFRQLNKPLGDVVGGGERVRVFAGERFGAHVGGGGAGVDDVLVSNQVVDPPKIARLAALASQARLGICADQQANVIALNQATSAAGTRLDPSTPGNWRSPGRRGRSQWWPRTRVPCWRWWRGRVERGSWCLPLQTLRTY